MKRYSIPLTTPFNSELSFSFPVRIFTGPQITYHRTHRGGRLQLFLITPWSNNIHREKRALTWDWQIRVV